MSNEVCGSLSQFDETNKLLVDFIRKSQKRDFLESLFEDLRQRCPRLEHLTISHLADFSDGRFTPPKIRVTDYSTNGVPGG